MFFFKKVCKKVDFGPKQGNFIQKDNVAEQLKK